MCLRVPWSSFHAALRRYAPEAHSYAQSYALAQGPVCVPCDAPGGGLDAFAAETFKTQPCTQKGAHDRAPRGPAASTPLEIRT